MDGFIPRHIIKELTEFKKDEFLNICRKFSLSKSATDKKNTWKLVKSAYTKFNALGVELDDYVMNANPSLVPAFYASLENIKVDIEILNSYDSVQAVLDKINLEAKRKGAKIIDYVDEETGEVLEEISVLPGIATISIQAPYFYHALFMIMSVHILRVLNNHISFYKEGATRKHLAAPSSGISTIQSGTVKLADALKKELLKGRYNPLKLIKRTNENERRYRERIGECYTALLTYRKTSFIWDTKRTSFIQIFSGDVKKKSPKIIWCGTNAQLKWFLKQTVSSLVTKDAVYERAAFYFKTINLQTQKVEDLTSEKIRNHKIPENKIKDRDKLLYAAKILQSTPQ